MINITGIDMEAIEEEETNNDHFARKLNAYKLFWVFFIGSFLGVIIEVAWCIITRFHYENRVGLIYGPFNPVYGFGAVIMTLGLYPVRKKGDRLIMISGALIGAIYEYGSSWIQEKVFNSVSWDYSWMEFNLHGRINLLYSILWGFLAIIWIKDIYSRMSRWILKIPNNIGKPLTWILLVFMLFNGVMSAGAVTRWAERNDNIPSKTAYEQYFDEHYPDDRMKNIFPNMQFMKDSVNNKQVHVK